MSFRSFAVAAGKSPLSGSGFGASLIRIRGGFAHLKFFLRMPVAEALGWGDGDMLEVAIGEEEHHGLVRLRKSPDGTAPVTKRKAAGGGQFIQISLGHVPAFVNRAEPKKWCSYEALEGEDEGWVEVVLPSWADETGTKQKRLLLSGPASVPPAPPRRNVTAALAGDPPPHRSALAVGRRQPTPQQVLTRGQARRVAEQREAPEMAAKEAEELQRRVEEVDRIGHIMQTFGLTKHEARVVRALMTAKVTDKEALHRSVYGDDPTGGPDIKIIDVFMTKIRKKLRTALVEIETVWGQGYQMKPEAVARLMVLLDGGTPGRDDDERELETMPSEDEEDAA